MKNLRFLISATVVLSAWPALGQNMFGLGIKAGVGINDTSVRTELPTQGSSSDKASFVGGGMFELHMGGPVDYQLEVLYTRRETTLHFLDPSGLPPITTVYKLDYLEFPTTVRVHFGEKSWQPYAFGGVNYGVLIQARSENTSAGATQSFGAIDQFRRMNVALEIGGGVRYRFVGKASLTGDVRYIYGLTDVAGNAGDSWKIREVRILAGCLFRL